MIDVDQVRSLSNRSAVASELIGMDGLRDIVFTQKSGQEGLRRFGVSRPLEEHVEHEPVLVHRSPKPVPDAIHARTHLVERPPGTPSGFPVTQVFSEQGSELDTPLAKSLVTDLNAALVQQFLNVSVAQWKSVVAPNGVLDDGHGESVAVRLGVSRSGSADPGPVKATQPFPLSSMGLALKGST